MVAASQAALIVQLGARGGTRDMVTSSGSGQNSTPSTYDAQTLYNPLAPALGYTGDAFGGAATKNQNSNWVNDVTTNSRNGRITDTGFDYIQVLANMGTSTNQAERFYEAMLVWDGGANGSGQSAFRSTDEIDAFHIEFKARGTPTPTTVSFLLETAAGWYVTDQTVTETGVGYTTFDANIADLTWTGFSQFGVTAGAGAPVVAGDEWPELYRYGHRQRSSWR